MNNIALITITLIILKFIFVSFLEKINQKQLSKNGNNVPPAFKDFINQEDYQKSIAYTLVKSNFSLIEALANTILLILVLFSGIMGSYYHWVENYLEFLPKVFMDSFYLFSFFFLYSLVSIPFSLYQTFSIENRFNFNNMTLNLWLFDFIKMTFISFLISIPLVAFILYLVGIGGEFWWVFAWLVFVTFQLIMMVVYPKIIMPLFNKLSPLDEGELREGIFQLTDKLKFSAKDILVMDGSRRSKHSNAFFTGIGKSRMVVFFDTLIKQLNIEEMKAVFAHEIGHYKKKHILQMIVFSFLKVFIFFYLVDFLKNSVVFNETFLLQAGNTAHTFMILTMILGVITFWTQPISNYFSRKNEFEADHYAKVAMGSEKPLITSLRKLYKENLGNLTPHRLYSFFYYSHPTLVEREKALTIIK